MKRVNTLLYQDSRVTKDSLPFTAACVRCNLFLFVVAPLSNTLDHLRILPQSLFRRQIPGSLRRLGQPGA